MSHAGVVGLGELVTAIEPLVRRVASADAAVELHRAWVLQDRVVVLEHLVHGAPVTFDVARGDGGGDAWRVEVIAREAVDAPLVRALGLDEVDAGRFRVATVTGLRGGDVDGVATQVARHCVAVLDRLAAAGPAPATRHLFDALDLTGRVVVVDVGANPLELPAYTRLLGLGLARVVGFEPQPEAFAKLQGRDPARELYLPHAIGTPGPSGLHVFEGSGFASTFDIDQTSIDVVGDPRWQRQTRLRGTIAVELTALDDVADLPAFDLLKIDVQGGELAVFRSGRRALANALCVIPEVSFFPLYRDAPTFAEVHQELVEQGFALHRFLFQKSVHLHGSQSGVGRIRTARSQLIDGDAVYLRDLRDLPDPTVFDDEQIKKLVLLATFVLDSPDLAVRALDELVRRGVVEADLPASYAAATYV